MSLVSAAVSPVANRLPKVVDARTHGMIDYAHATFFLGMAVALRRKNPRAAAAALMTGSLVLVQSLLTDYPLGAKGILPFALHGQMDGGFAAFSYTIPKVFGFEGTGAATVFKVNTFVESAVVAMTDFDSERAREQKL